MIYDYILVRYGDLTLKGKNQKVFLNRLYKLIRTKMKGLDVQIRNTRDRTFIDLNGVDHTLVEERLSYVSGISSYSLVCKCEPTMDSVKETALELVKAEVKTLTKFKVDTKRSNKNFELTSQEITKEVAGFLLTKTDGLLKTDVHNPKLFIRVEFRKDAAYVFTKDIKALGGFPVGVSGKGLLMMSGGIDSPVAGILSMKQGVEVECFHFESTPLTSIESAQKVVDLAKIMARYSASDQIRVHMVPFRELHQALLEYIPENYNITIMRRMMYRIADGYAKKRKIRCIINGENVGQVASQTLDSMYVINAVSNLPIIRPLSTMNKNEIIDYARRFSTYTTSIKPFEDCCTVYLPKAPATCPKLEKCEKFEAYHDFTPLINSAIENVKTITVKMNSDLDLADYGLEVRDAIDSYYEELHNDNK